MIEAIVDYLLLNGRKYNGEMWGLPDLQNLLYCCQGWHLALRGEVLITEPFEAWKDGPALKSVNKRLGHYKDRPIGPEAVLTQPGYVLSDEVRVILDQVMSDYSGLEKFAIANLTHSVGTPWRITRDQAGVTRDGICSDQISEELILGWFSAALQKRLSPAANHTRDQDALKADYEEIIGRPVK